VLAKPRGTTHFIRKRFKGIGGKSVCLPGCPKVSLPRFFVRAFLGLRVPDGLSDKRQSFCSLAKKGIVELVSRFKPYF
jgi:hypothetical protein